MAEKKGRDLDGGVPVGPPQHFTTGGNVITPVEGFASDSGCGKPPAPGVFGAIASGPTFPEGSKMPGGNGKAQDAYFGSRKPGGK